MVQPPLHSRPSLLSKQSQHTNHLVCVIHHITESSPPPQVYKVILALYIALTHFVYFPIWKETRFDAHYRNKLSFQSAMSFVNECNKKQYMGFRA